MLTRTHDFPAPRRLTAALVAALPLCLLGHVSASQAALVISQVYGGGGNAGATYKNDFVELLNNGSAAVSAGGWSVQYASATGSTWQVTQLPAGLLVQPGQYVLVQMAAGTGGTTALAPDVLGTIAMSGTSGKVALVASTTALTGATPAGLIDVVSYGSSTPIEGTPTPVLSNTTAALRADGGCADTNNNVADFVVGS
ncbi:MAG: lamin tail domain-containing protein [Burkholderiales bacterium]|nr:lamin tail domain-containing protein [Burkholderiales bacterium]